MKAWVVFLVLSLLLVLASPVYAQLPPTPQAFWGDVTLNGAPAPVGATVVARVGGVERGSITVTETGKYESASPLLSKLVVQGDILGGSTIVFYVNGAIAAETYPFTSGATTELNLTAGTAPTPIPTPTQSLPTLPDPSTLIMMGSVLIAAAAYLLIRAGIVRVRKG